MIGKAGTKTIGGKRIRREKMKNKFMLKEISSHKIIKHILLLQKIKRKVSSWKFKTYFSKIVTLYVNQIMHAIF